MDDPWRRLPWVIATSLSVWVLLLYGFLLMLQGTAPPPESVKPIEVSFTELPVVVESHFKGSSSAAVVRKPAPLPVVRHRKERERPKPLVRHKPRAIAPARKPEEKKVAAIPSAPREAPPAQSNEQQPSHGAAPQTSTAATHGTGGAPGGIGTASNGVQAIYTPLPSIPDELRQNPLNTIAVARFLVSPDGQATIVLVKPTPDSRLNQLLLATLRRWQFHPATRNGKPVTSTFEVRIPIVVR
jgi:periplasmic protein TonB